MKKKYMTPQMIVVELNHHMSLLVGSTQSKLVNGVSGTTNFKQDFGADPGEEEEETEEYL